MSEEKQENFKYIASIRFRNTRKPYTFGTNDETLEYGDFVVVETARGLEMGEMISSLRQAETFSGQTVLKPIYRKATPQDRRQHEENKELAKEAMKKCAECIQHQQLDMNLISCEYTLDRSKVIFIYVSENRVDFRELLKELTQIFKCRIELRQIGPRDKAKMVGGLGACGLETCCSRFLDNFDVVSINMAKNQLLALNIPKLSGQCGKLMCCLKYEDALYKEMREGLPKMNAQLEYEGKLYRLTSMNVITGQCKIENKENALFMTIEEMLQKTVVKKPVQNQPQARKEKEAKPEKKKETQKVQENGPAEQRKEKATTQPQKRGEEKHQRKEGKKEAGKAESGKKENRGPKRKPDGRKQSEKSDENNEKKAESIKPRRRRRRSRPDNPTGKEEA